MKAKILVVLSFVAMTFVPVAGIASEDEFEDFEETSSVSSDSSAQQDEFADFSDESGDEFEEFSDSAGEFTEVADDAAVEPEHKTNWNRFYWAVGILAATILAGFFVRNEKTRKLRPLFLLAAVVVLGFYRGGPGVISSFQNTVLYAIGAKDVWPAIVLFLGVVVLTYFFGRVFCGWTCYLGAIQEFLYISKIKILQTEKAQKIMRTIRTVLLVVLLAQLLITRTIEWNKIGPFRVLFNLYSPNITGYILLGILLISSLFIYRPFCKMVCPVGLILGWVTKLPGASVLGINGSCTGCAVCNNSCQINAITREGKVSKLDNQECIMCGDCMSGCKFKSIKPYRNTDEHKGQIVLKSIKKLKM